MGQWLAALGLMLGLAAPAFGQGAGPRGLATGDDAAGWEAVGRIDIDGKGFCTGALIAPDLVLTAAHCLHDRATRGEVAPSRIAFLAGLRDGRALATRGVRRTMRHPAYVFASQAGARGSHYDLALLELDQPIRSTGIVPFTTGHGPTAGTEVAIVSYAAGRSDAPALEEACGVLGEEAGVVVMACEVDFGSSGAPVFQTLDGVTRIVSVVSAKGEMDGTRVALGSTLADPLAMLRAAFAASAGQGPGRLPQVRAIAPGERAETGARFVLATP